LQLLDFQYALESAKKEGVRFAKGRASFSKKKPFVLQNDALLFRFLQDEGEKDFGQFVRNSPFSTHSAAGSSAMAHTGKLSAEKLAGKESLA